MAHYRRTPQSTQYQISLKLITREKPKRRVVHLLVQYCRNPENRAIASVIARARLVTATPVFRSRVDSGQDPHIIGSVFLARLRSKIWRVEDSLQGCKELPE